MRRKPAVAGSFYPAWPDALRREVEAYLGPEASGAGEPAFAVLAPHAGYMYSGPCAGATYAKAHVPARVVVLGPNHTGLGAPLAIMDSGTWETPFGDVPIDTSLARAIERLDARLRVDALAHAREHSLEVQIPFLLRRQPELSLVPICVGTHRLADLVELGDALAEAIRGAGDDVLIVISSDMSHYIPFEEARARDARAITKMEALDPEGLHEVVEREGISMCGYCPAVVGLRAARGLGATTGSLVSYTSSGDRSGDYDSVVAYAGLVFH